MDSPPAKESMKKELLLNHKLIGSPGNDSNSRGYVFEKIALTGSLSISRHLFAAPLTDKRQVKGVCAARVRLIYACLRYWSM